MADRNLLFDVTALHNGNIFILHKRKKKKMAQKLKSNMEQGSFRDLSVLNIKKLMSNNKIVSVER